MQATTTELTKWERKRLARDAMKGAESRLEYYRKPYWMAGIWFLEKAGEHRRSALVRMDWVMNGRDRKEIRMWLESYFEWKGMAKARMADAMDYKGRVIPLP